jgi:uncharacterized membrane protein (DUF106 family)
MQVNFLVQLALALRAILGPWAQAPLAALTVLGVSVLMGLITNLVNRHFIDYERMRRARTEVNKWQAMKREAAAATDEREKRRLLLQIRRRERYIMKIQGDIGKQSFMPMIVTLVPFMLVFAIMNGIFLNDTLIPGVVIPTPVLYSPLNFAQLLGGFGVQLGYLPEQGYPGVPPVVGQALTYLFWYILVSFAANMVFQRVFGTSMTPGTSMAK